MAFAMLRVISSLAMKSRTGELKSEDTYDTNRQIFWILFFLNKVTLKYDL